MKTVREKVKKLGLEIKSASVVYMPLNTVGLSGREMEQAIKLIDALGDHDEVVNVFDNITER